MIWILLLISVNANVYTTGGHKIQITYVDTVPQCNIIRHDHSTMVTTILSKRDPVEEAQALFCQIPTIQDKANTILDKKIEPNFAAKLLSGDCPNNIDVADNDDIKAKINETCESLCQDLRKEVIKETNQAESKIEQHFNEKDNILLKNIQDVKKWSDGLTKLSTSVKAYVEATVDPNNVRKKLVELIDDSKAKNYLTDEQHEAMTKKVIDATTFDPIWTTEFNEITASTKRELGIQRQHYLSQQERNKGLKKKAKNYLKKTKNGFLATSNPAKLEKGLKAVSNLVTGIEKLTTGDPLKVTSGVLDIANTIAEFLPPPASIVTGTLSGIFNIFGLGGSGPSNQDVIDEIKSGFKEQKSFIRTQFEKQQKFITDELNNLAFTEFKTEAVGLLDEIGEKLGFIETFIDGVDNDNVANSVRDEIDVLGQTKETSKLRSMIKETCVPQLTSCKDKEVKKTCLFLIHTVVTIEKYRYITVTNLINMLQSTNLRQLNGGYLKVQKRRKTKIKSWIDTTLLSDPTMSCIISYKMLTQYWTSKEQLEIVDFINYIDPAFSTKLANVDCSVVKENYFYNCEYALNNLLLPFFWHFLPKEI